MRWGLDMTGRHPSSALARRSHERGAALVIGLILLLMLTLLAVSGMNSASLEFIMAGNEQDPANAFQAAEAGIGQRMGLRVFNPAPMPPPPHRAPQPTDNRASTITPQLRGAPQPALRGHSSNSF